VEKYRPETLGDMLGHKKIIESLKGYVVKKEMPHLLFVGKSGTGKTAAAVALSRDLGCHPTGFLETLSDKFT